MMNMYTTMEKTVKRIHHVFNVVIPHGNALPLPRDSTHFLLCDLDETGTSQV
jgi:hypothetical protein